MNHIMKLLKSLFFKFFIFVKEKKYRGRLKYLFEDNKSDELIIVFSGFGVDDKPRYNYVRTLRSLSINKLFILDNFGYKGSYYWFENGNDYPEKLTRELIEQIITKKKYAKIYTAGSSKGGTSAIYFGLQICATAIFSGACQYNVGSYLNQVDRMPIFKSMMGSNASTKEEIVLDSIMPKQIEKFAHSKCLVYLIYSKEEHTYKEHIIDLIKQIKQNDICYEEQIGYFTEHSGVGTYFVAFLRNYFGLN